MAHKAYREDVRPSDGEAVRRVVESTGFFNTEEVEIAVELVLERLERGLKSGYYFLFLELAGEVIGYTCFGPIYGTESSFDLYWIAVHNDYRGKGYGKELMARSEEIIAVMGGRRIYVETSSRQQYEPTRNFYKARGYAQEAVIKDFYAPGDSKVICVKEVPM